jgi:hypothetical protein
MLAFGTPEKQILIEPIFALSLSNNPGFFRFLSFDPLFNNLSLSVFFDPL